MAGAGTVTYAITHIETDARPSGKGGFKVLTFTCVGDSSGGGIPDTTIDAQTTIQLTGCYLIKVQMVPLSGGTGPTANSDVYIKDANTIDLLDGNGVDKLDNATNSEAYAQIDGQPALQPIVGALTLNVTGDTVASAAYSIICIFVSTR